MNIKELQNLLNNISEENIDFDEPHVSLRCEENNITKEKIINIMTHKTESLYNFIQDRPGVYKLYFKLNERRQLKVIIDLLKAKRIMVRTVKILDRKLYKNIKLIKRKRF